MLLSSGFLGTFAAQYNLITFLLLLVSFQRLWQQAGVSIFSTYVLQAAFVNFSGELVQNCTQNILRKNILSQILENFATFDNTAKKEFAV